MKQLHTHTDERGSLTVAEIGQDIPFDVKRVYWIYNVPEEKSRGNHANRTSYQYLVAVKGWVRICLENKNGREFFLLDSPDKGLLIPPLTWNELLEFSTDAVLLVMSSQLYDPRTYINTHEEFMNIIL